MKIIIPMAGMGTRLRPHTLTVPKPLIVLAGKSIVQRLVEGISKLCSEKISEIAFVIGNFGADVEQQLLTIAKNVGAKGKIYYQHQALGTAHAVYCAAESMTEKTVIAFADTLFYADFKIDNDADSTIWVQRVKNPENYGVVCIDENGLIKDFVEKPKNFVSDLAIIGIYYFKESEILRNEIQNLIDNKIMVNGEYQLTTALENLKNQGLKFKPAEVREWLDCGNKNITISTHKRILQVEQESDYISKNTKIINSTIVHPCYIADDVIIENSIVGPFVSVGVNSKIKDSIIKNSIIQNNSDIFQMLIHNSMIGSNTVIHGDVFELSIGDFNNFELK
ncbi:MAG: sugar phosphate nucleotidyltransferase [Bacteroidales bacterium]|jgi:glucose-1-phosphate thymidylyltransferase|nr:sugar phosphate nucleotidyltransferase [Bacteroidales bacterium]HOL99070.1 sugar phosphate nucleotidyltransferase [Bacteroidales bacterium]HOM37457.1 sugar phosphate nucleotidyltransferase [Bacteroidales bacterium]HPD24939.1 sugar phosphate nucleotidyltransferase [Bacteroidales bacterium]HRT00663.1 sugar phosphate nucleotidyltransferase [Bacteroidales bacterium]